MYETLDLGSRDEPEKKRSNNPFTCVRCIEDFDLDDDTHFEDDEGYICEECRYHCVLCGGPCGDNDSEECRLDGDEKVCLPCFAFIGSSQED